MSLTIEGQVGKGKGGIEGGMIGKVKRRKSVAVKKQALNWCQRPIKKR